jgi:hypothetical protein
VESAHRWLLDFWPAGVSMNESYLAAVEACAAALDGRGEVDEARVAMIITAADAAFLDGATVV